MALDRFITLSEAAQRMRTSVKETRSMIKSGKIKGGLLSDGAMVVSEETIPKRKEDQRKKEDVKEYKMYAHLKSRGIGVNQAAKDYGVPYTTLYQWFQRGYIKSVGRVGQKVLLNEQDVAYCAKIYLQSGSQGRRLFNADGTPYKPKNGSSSK